MMRGRLSNVFALALVGCALCVTAVVAAAQNSGARQGPAPRTPPREGAQGAAAADAENADLAITARVTARELLFRKVPNPRVEFTGRPRRETVWEAERQNLPEEVQPGVTYRDIGITLRITSVFADIDRIVAEALGEIPPSDDAPPRQGAPTEPPSAPPAPTTQTSDNQSVKPEGSRAISTSSPAPTARRQSRPRRGREQ
jgi:hypothetical protein